MPIVSLLAALGLVMPLSVPVSAPVAVHLGPVPEHHVFALLRDYFPSSNISIKQGEGLRFVDTDPTAGPGHSLTETGAGGRDAQVRLGHRSARHVQGRGQRPVAAAGAVQLPLHHPRRAEGSADGWLTPRWPRSWAAAWPWAPRSRSRAGSAPGATPRPAGLSFLTVSRRLVLRRRPGRGRADAGELRDRGPPPHHRLRRGGDGRRSSSRRARGRRSRSRRRRSRCVGWVEDPDTYPVSAKRHTFEYLREVAHLRPRTNTFGAVTRVRHCLSQAVHRFFHERGFFWIHTPIITANDAEGAGAMFRVSTLDLANLPRDGPRASTSPQDFFGREAHLTVSGQLNVEAYCLAMSKVYTFGPTFRAENSNTARHLAEFWMIEPEIAFADLSDRRRPRRGVPQVHLPGRARRAGRRHGVLRRAHRQGLHHPARGVRRLQLRADGLHRRDRRPGEGRPRAGRSSSSRSSGASTSSPSTSAT